MPDRDRLRQLLDAVLDEDNRALEDMAADAYASPFHFSHVLRRAAGEPPMAMRRRVMLERAAWQLREGASVTDAAWAADYDSVEGFSRAFSRAFGHPPSQSTKSHWLPAPNGIHFHPPMSLWVNSTEAAMNPLAEQLVIHDIDDTRLLLEAAGALDEDQLRQIHAPGAQLHSWGLKEESILDVLTQHVAAKVCWLAAIGGTAQPAALRDASPHTLSRVHEETAARWLEVVRDIDRREAWNDRLIDAVCEPPESFLLSGVVAHVVTYSAHRRLLARQWMRGAGVDVDDGDPIMWLRRVRGEEA